jgi:adenylosuccinate synthase
VEYKTFPGWKAETTKARKYEDLPAACKEYLEFLENELKVPIKFIGVGKDREALIFR